jgi:hypothetical protein
MTALPPAAPSSHSAWLSGLSAALATMDDDQHGVKETDSKTEQLNVAALHLLFAQGRD